MRAKRFSELSRTARAYVTLITAAGVLAVAHSSFRLISDSTPWDWTILALLTLVSGSATVKLPSLPATISVSETFVFTSVLLFGVPAGTLTVALDALVISFWSYRRGHPLYKIVFNLFALPLTIWVAAQLFFSLPSWKPLLTSISPLFRSTAPVQISHLLGPLAVLALVYFCLNSWIIALAIAFERGLPTVRIWRENFAWLSLNYFGGASVAALLVTYTRNIDWGYLALIVPLLVVLYLTFSTAMGRVADANKHLLQLNSLYMSTIETLAMAIDAKDQITHGHIRRVQIYAVDLAKRLGVADPTLIKAIEAAALLHDMGKLAVPEYILNKPGPLTPAEFDKMKLHASVGADILSSIEFPYPVVPVVRHHHENWDGSGYPDGLAGTTIPIGARILSVVDCFDALTSDRPYRPRLADNQAIQILLERRGTMYDPLVVDKFLEVHSQIRPEQMPQRPTTSFRAITEASVGSVLESDQHHPLEEIAASAEEMLTLFDLARGLNSRMSVQDAGDVIAKHLRRLVPCSLCIFFHYDGENDELVASHASGEGAALVTGLRIGLGQRLSGWVAANRRVIRNSDAVLDLGESARAITPRPRSSLSAPLVCGGSLVGVLTLYSTKRQAFSEEHQRIVEVVSRQVSTILRHASEFERAKTGIFRDRTTGLPNLRHLKELGADQLIDLGPDPTSVLLIKVDSLAQYGISARTEAGEEVLQRIVTATRRNLRAADFLFRFGGEEFLVLCLHTHADICRVIGRRVQEALEQESRNGSGPVFAFSWSVASTPVDGESIDDLLRVAQDRLRTGSIKVTERPPKLIH